MKTTFESCGLHSVHNLFKDVVSETNIRNLYFRNETEMVVFANAALYTIEYNSGVIFIISKNNRLDIVVKFDEIMQHYYKNNCDVFSEILNIQRDFDFPCCGVIEQIDDGSYSIIIE